MRFLRFTLSGLAALISLRGAFPKIVGRIRWTIGILLTLLGGLGTFLGVAEYSQFDATLRTDYPGLRCWAPVPMDNTKFTLAMSPFIVIDEAGKVTVDNDGYELARLLFTRLDAAFEEIDLTLPHELRGPDQTCAVRGDRPGGAHPGGDGTGGGPGRGCGDLWGGRQRGRPRPALSRILRGL